MLDTGSESRMWPLRPSSDPCLDGRELFFLSIDGRQIYGASFVVIRPESGTGPRSPRDTIFVQHWFQELSRLVPVD